ncbi:MAG: hypothetical protein ACI96M_004671 [Candidatus Azotimanducaceae bacterium]
MYRDNLEFIVNKTTNMANLCCAASSALPNFWVIIVQD